MKSKSSSLFRLMTFVLVLTWTGTSPLWAAGQQAATAQDSAVTVTGTVVDETDLPAPGVHVYIKGTRNGVATDINGKYTIQVPGASTILQFSFISYTTIEETVGQRRTIDVKLKVNAKELEGVVVVGYQTTQKRFVSGSVSSVDAEELANLPSTNFSSLLAGKSPGLMSINLGGAPGAQGAIVIRGNTVVSGSLNEADQFSNPLYVIDGVPTTLEEAAGYGKTNNDFLSSLNMDDIERIDILKDASAAAIYGSRGANGVIIIKTKQGRPGKMQVHVKAMMGVTVKPNLLTTPVGAAERRMKMGQINNTWGYNSLRDGLPIMLTDSLNPAFNNHMDYQGLYYQTGIVQDYSASISGGTEQLSYRLSLGYTDEKGIIRETGLKRYTATLNLTQQPWKRVRNQTIINFSYLDRKPGSGNANSRGYFPVSFQDMNSSLFRVSEDQYNLITGSLNNYYRTDRTFNTQITDILNVDIWNGLALNTQISALYNGNKRNQFEPSVLRTDKRGHVMYDYFQRMGMISENYLSYTRDLGTKHNLNVLLGTSYEFNQNETNEIEAYGGSGDMIHTVTGYKQEDITATTAIGQNSMLSFWGRLGYRFLERYQLDVNLRRDASSKFGKNKRWATFPSIGAFWIFSDESFLDFTDSWLTFGKLKYSVGKNGKQFTDDYLRYNMYQLGYNSFSGLGTGAGMSPTTYNGTTAVIPDFTKLADDNLSWEVSTQHNLGIDLEFFKSRIYLSGDFYVKNTESQLFDVQFPDYTGFAQVKANVVGVRNHGYEVSVDAHLFPRTNDLTMQVMLGLSRNTNTITKLPNGNREYYDSYNNVYGYTVGKPGPLYLGTIYEGPLKSMDDLAVDPFTGKPISLNDNGYWGTVEPGYPVYKDVNGNYIVSNELDEDRVLTDYDPNPKVMGNLNLRVGYKNWTLQANSHFVFGRDIYDYVSNVILSRYDGTDWPAKAMVNLPDYDFWTPSNPNAYYPSLLPQAAGVNSRNAFRGRSTMWWEDGSFWKLNDVTLSYNFKQEWMKKAGMERLYVYATAYNVYQWQKSKRVTDASMVDALGYVIGDGYPVPRKYVIGFNIQF